jgi:DNA-binding transcriptional LysR family regulator
MQRRHDALNIPIEVLRSFVAIQESGSFTKAADLLRLTQPAISAQVKRLQQLVGGEVFTRTGFGVSLTEKGEVVSRYARRILAMNDQILSLSGTTSARSIRVGLSKAFAGIVLPDVLSVCRELLADERIQFTCEASSELGRSLACGYLDIAFVYSHIMPPGKAVARWPEPLNWVCSNDFVLSPGAPIPLLSWPNSVIDQTAIDVIEAVGLQYSIVFVASDLMAHMSALRAGLGFHCLPERIVPPDLKLARERYLPPLPPFESGVYLREGLESEPAFALAEAIAAVVRPGAREQKIAAGDVRHRRA